MSSNGLSAPHRSQSGNGPCFRALRGLSERPHDQHSEQMFEGASAQGDKPLGLAFSHRATIVHGGMADWPTKRTLIGMRPTSTTSVRPVWSRRRQRRPFSIRSASRATCTTSPASIVVALSVGARRAASYLWCSRFGEHGCASSQRAMPPWSRSVGIVDGESDGVRHR